VLKRLAAEGISSLLIEGGGEMAASFLEGGWVDRVYFFIAPVLIGGRTAKTSVEGKGIARLRHALSLKNVKVSLLSRDLLVEGEL
jgi:diaminohydroxyphosphoribosylaminopyrimidine deaminase/5-amino-6-(5-phosphoribosylamino)uracil reductase